MGQYDAILKKSEEFASNMLHQNMAEHLHYHNYAHTAYVVEIARKIAEAQELSEEKKELVQIAAWFHDLGYSEKSNGHEAISQEIAQKFLREQKLAEPALQEILLSIGATKIPQSPQSELSMILCDADLAHLAEEDFFDRCTPLRAEWEAERGNLMSDTEWLEINQNFMEGHKYFTEYGKEALNPAMRENLRQVEKKLKKVTKDEDKVLMEDMDISQKKLKKLRKKLDKVEGRPERGIETVFRTTSRNHLDLSSMADSKANIMISVNTIIISVVISLLLNKFNTHPHLIFPTLILLLTCLVTIVFAILATRPNVSSGLFTRDDIENRRTNLLFFGNFHKMRLEDYEWGMQEMLNDGDYLYRSLIRDIYFLGAVLGKKYRMLRTAYTIFMFGLVISVLSFILSVVIYEIQYS